MTDSLQLESVLVSNPPMVVPTTLPHVQVGDTNVTATCLGFGCATLFRLPRQKERLNVLAAAYDSGIRHFDVAPLYGFGEAEKDLGRFLRGRRHKVTITTKFGIEPSRIAKRLRYLQPLARIAANAFPVLKRAISGQSAPLRVPGQFDVRSAYRSLTESLNSLQTQEVDLFLLHEPTIEDVISDELALFLEKLSTGGLIKSWGLSGIVQNIAKVALQRPALLKVLQFGNDALAQQIRQINLPRTSGIITFGAISGAMPYVWERINAEPDGPLRWSRRIGVDLGSRAAVAFLLFSYAVRSNPTGIVLFSTSTPHHAVQAARWMQDGLAPAEILDAFLVALQMEAARDTGSRYAKT